MLFSKLLTITAVVVILLLSLVAYGTYTSATAPDTQCATIHTTTMQPPYAPTSAKDYFARGNYDYNISNA
jgi:hypothetical protein